LLIFVTPHVVTDIHKTDALNQKLRDKTPFGASTNIPPVELPGKKAGGSNQ